MWYPVVVWLRSIIWNTGAPGVSSEMQLFACHYMEVQRFIHSRILQGTECVEVLMEPCGVYQSRTLA